MQITLNKQHPGFDMTKEVMAMVPKLPHSVDLDDVADELQITRERAMAIVRQINRRHRVSLVPGKRDIAIGAPPKSFADIREIAQHYMDRVYP